MSSTTSHPPCLIPGKEIRELDLRERIGMRPIQQHQVHLAIKPVPRHGILGLALDENHVFGSKIGLFTQLSDCSVLAFYRKSDVPMARVR